MILRKLYAGFRSIFAGIWGVTLYDYNNGDPELIGDFDWPQMDVYDSLVENGLTNGRDVVYLSCFKQGNNRGYFLVNGSNGKLFTRSFWDRTYYAAWAYKEAIDACKDLSKQLGYRVKVSTILSDIKEPNEPS